MLTLVLLTRPLMAQFPATLKVKRLTTTEGLASNQVFDIRQDRQGFIWLATANGVSRYDGYQFVNYQHSPTRLESLSEGEIHSLYEDRTGTLWLSGSVTLHRYDRQLDAFERISLPITSGTRTTTLLGEDARGHLLISHEGGGCWSFDPHKKTFQLWEPLSVLRNEAMSLSVTSLQSLGAGRYLLSTWGAGVMVVDSAKGTVVTFQHNPANPASLPGNVVSSSCRDNRGRIWIGTDRGLCRYDDIRKTFVYQSLKVGEEPLVRHLLLDTRGWLWVGTEGGGIFIVDPESGKTRQYTQDLLFDDRLSENYCSALYQDRDGNIWTNANKKGVHLITRHSLVFSLYRREPDQPESLVGNDVLSLAEEPGGRLWIGLNKKGLQSFDRTTNRFRLYQHEPGNLASLANNSVLKVLVDRNGTRWVGSWRGGLQKLVDPEHGRFVTYRLENDRPFLIGKNSVFALYEDRKGQLWAGTYTDGLFKFDPKTGRWTANYLPSMPPLMSREQSVYSIAEDATGAILVGTVNGLYRLDTTQRQLVPVFFGKTRKITVPALYRDARQHVWAATNEGLYELDARLRVLRVLTEKNGLPHTSIQSVVADRSGMLWLTTENGVVQLNPRTRKVVATFFNEDGLPGNKFNFGATLPLLDGSLALGSTGGMVLFRPERIRPLAAPTVVLTGFQLFGQPQPVGGSSPLTQSPFLTNSIVLNWQQSVFGFEFAALDFTNPSKNQYAFRMEGFEDRWNYVGPRRYATYTNLPPGDYTFHIRAANHQGIWNETGTRIHVQILPPFWAAWWFRLLALLAVVGGIFFLFRTRTRQLKQRQRELSEEVEKRTRELRLANAEIGRKNGELQQQKEEIAVQAAQLHELDELKLRFFTNISHEFRTPLTLILSPIEKLLSVAGANESTRRQYQVIRRNARNLLNLLNQLLDVIKLESGNMRLHLVPGDLVGYVKELTEQFRYLAERQAIQFSLITDMSTLWVHFDADALEKMLYNLLSNAFKFTPDGGSVEVRLSQKESNGDRACVVFTILDTGIGLNPEQLSNIFEHFYQVQQTVWRKMPGSGVGLALVKQLVELHDGQITAQSREGHGTSFEMVLPLTRVQFSPSPTPSSAANGVARRTTPVPDHAPLVLVVEDDAELRAFISQLLMDEFHVKGAVDGLEAWELATRLLPDLIITDIAMPRMDGLKLCQRLKADQRTLPIPVIVLTAKSDTADRLGGLNVGADDYLTKPFDPILLQSRVRQLIEQRQKLRERFTREYKPKPKETGLSDEQFLLQVEQIVTRCLANPDFDVDEFVMEIGMSRAQLYRRIKQVTGLAVNDYIRKARLKQAASLILLGGGSIADVMADVGFNTPSHFSQCFKAEYGCTPTEYARSIK